MPGNPLVTPTLRSQGYHISDADDGMVPLPLKQPDAAKPQIGPLDHTAKPAVVAVPKHAPAPAPRCGTLFGHLPNDGKGQPINELLCDIRGAFVMTFIWPRFIAAWDARIKAEQGHPS